MKPLSILMTVALTGCATRALPQTFAVGSPTSTATSPAPVVDVTSALRTEPPLPGEDGAGWAGLEPAAEGSVESTSATGERKAGHDHAH